MRVAVWMLTVGCMCCQAIVSSAVCDLTRGGYCATGHCFDVVAYDDPESQLASTQT